MKTFSNKILVAGTILLGMIVIVLVILTFQKGFSERPSLEDSVAIRSSIEGFIKAKDIEDRMNFVTESPKMQRNLRSYLLIPYDQRQILNQEIAINNIWLDEKSDRKEAVVQQELEYLTLDNEKTYRLRITYRLEKQTKWLIDDFQAKVIKK